MMHKGEMNGYICQGFNPLQAFPDRGKIRRGSASSSSWSPWIRWTRRRRGSGKTTARATTSNPAEHPDRSLPAADDLLCGRERLARQLVRWLQWHGQAATPPGQAKSDIWIMAGIFQRMRALYRKEGGALPDPILNLTWNYTDPTDPIRRSSPRT